MRRTLGWTFAILAVLLIIGAQFFPSSVYEESPPPFGTAAVYSHEEFPDPVAIVLMIGALAFATGAAGFFWKEIRRGVGGFIDALAEYR
ncbi:MAG: hypothetical protein Q8R35_00990 [bacterium]|nr:hypothetical protein [bacterium]